MMLEGLQLINDEFHAASVKPETYDTLLADAWRHFGNHFFRYNLGIYENEIRRVIPLRIRLDDLALSKSQRRVLRKNADLETVISSTNLTPEIHDLFQRHKRRFKGGVPDSIYDFLSRDAANVPTDGFEITVRREGKLLAASFFDVGANSVSAIYGCFDPDEFSRSLGIFTMLKVMEHCIATDKTFYYHGYAYEGNSYYDYKKRFSGLEQYDWKRGWLASGFQI
jgi:arginine-tRNA-protein transferase